MNRKRLSILSFIVICLLFLVAGIFFINTHSCSDSHHLHESSHHEKNEKEREEENIIYFSDEQMNKFNIKTIIISKENLQKKLIFPGQISLNENNLIHIVPSVSGTVTEIFKGLGETTYPGEALARIQSREMAEAKSDYVSAYQEVDLQKDIFDKDEKLWEQKIKSNIQFMQIKYLYENSKIKLEQTKQKLLALGMTLEEIKELPIQKIPFNLYTINSPINGKIIDRHISLGEVISNDKQVFVIADLNTVWVNLAIPSENLSLVKKDQKVDVFIHSNGATYSGTITYVSPVIDASSRTGRAIIELNNKDRGLNPGDFIKAQVTIDEKKSLFSVPSSAVQRIGQDTVVFKKISQGNFIIQPININRDDMGDFVEVINGLNEGDEIVGENSFLFKAEFEKNEAEHSH